VIRWAFTFGLIIVLPFGVSQWGDMSGTFPFDIKWRIAFIIFAMTFLTYLLTVYGLNKISPTIVSAYIYLQPILATIIAVSTGVEKLTWTAIVYGLMIFLGVFLVSIPMAKSASHQKLKEDLVDN